MKKIGLKNGYVVVPDECIVIRDTRTENANYAAAIVERYQTIPHYLVLSDEPLDYTMQYDSDIIIAVWGRYYPQLWSVWHAEVDAIKDADGRLLNSKEWDASPRLCMFPIPEVQNQDKLYLGFGIIRKEK